MKTMVIGGLMATLVAFQAVGQRAENDDMYFNSKDRKKLNESAKTDERISSKDKIDNDYKAFAKKHFDKEEDVVAKEGTTNPTDSYSARNVNPEYVARSNSEQASEDEQNYYDEDYKPNATDSYSSSNYNNSGYDNWNNSRYYGSRWNSYSPYYGSCNPWMSPYYSGGSGMMVTISYGNGWGSPYYSPYGYYSPYDYYSPYGYYSPYSYYGYGYNYPNYYYGGSEYTRGNYGKRPSRHSSIVTPTSRLRQQTSNSNNSIDGRIRKSDEYYVKPARRTSENMNSESSTDRSNRSNNGSFDTSKTRTNGNSGTSRPTFSPSRNSSSGSPSRSSSSSSSSPRRRN